MPEDAPGPSVTLKRLFLGGPEAARLQAAMLSPYQPARHGQTFAGASPYSPLHATKHWFDQSCHCVQPLKSLHRRWAELSQGPDVDNDCGTFLRHLSRLCNVELHAGRGLRVDAAGRVFAFYIRPHARMEEVALWRLVTGWTDPHAGGVTLLCLGPVTAAEVEGLLRSMQSQARRIATVRCLAQARRLSLDALTPCSSSLAQSSPAQPAVPPPPRSPITLRALPSRLPLAQPMQPMLPMPSMQPMQLMQLMPPPAAQGAARSSPPPPGPGWTPPEESVSAAPARCRRAARPRAKQKAPSPGAGAATDRPGPSGTQPAVRAARPGEKPEPSAASWRLGEIINVLLAPWQTEHSGTGSGVKAYLPDVQVYSQWRRSDD
ncbi:MAG: hypothetical protein MO853_00210 [Candidatus Protistobacter heckmanni]|nr:hypothetical protein [Candidatus Protistobacter heckmanni]